MSRSISAPSLAFLLSAVMACGAHAQTKGTFTQDYKFTDPTTKKIAPKTMYCEKLDDAVVCGGVYK